jgi:hypothetical protein
MGKKSRKKKIQQPPQPVVKETGISTEVEILFKKILRIMSWTVGLCFLVIITLPNFEFNSLDAIIKFVFFLGVFCLFLFIIFEFFGESFKKFLSKRMP